MTYRFDSISKEDWQKQAYGTTESNMRESFKGQIALVGRDMFVASILSDIQECIEHEDYESARRFANRAKFVLFDM
jgi:hypothetical protein